MEVRILLGAPDFKEESYMNANQYEQFMNEVRENEQPCKHGHLGCSDEYGGRCCDEEWSNLTDEERELLQQ